MGAITGEIGDLRDLMTEEVGCKSGLLLTDREAHILLERAGNPAAEVFDGDRDRIVRLRSEGIEEIILHLRHRIGDLPDPEHGTMGRIRWAVDLSKRGIDPSPIYNALKAVVASGNYHTIDDKFAEEMVRISGMDPLLVDEFLILTGSQLDRSVNWSRAETIDLSWAVPLRQVFQTESVPDDPECYLDQRFIDYFAQNNEDLTRIHWRNFERLTSEFFQRKGYEVQLGPGTSDGGVDVRVWPGGADKGGPPLLLIQCKRHAEGHDVGIETVKAFWSDVVYEDAKHGLIATTSRIAPGGVSTSRARRWPLGFAQYNEVSHWVKTLWRHAPEL